MDVTLEDFCNNLRPSFLAPLRPRITTTVTVRGQSSCHTDCPVSHLATIQGLAAAKRSSLRPIAVPGQAAAGPVLVTVPLGPAPSLGAT